MGWPHLSHQLHLALATRLVAQLRAPEGQAAPTPPARAPGPVRGAALWGLLPGGWPSIEEGTGTWGKASHQRAPRGTTPLVGRSGTDVSGAQDSVASRWRHLSREVPGALRAETPLQAPKVGPSTLRHLGAYRPGPGGPSWGLEESGEGKLLSRGSRKFPLAS